jgi:hypothetical protein
MWRCIVVGAVAFVGALLSRLLVDWEDGRWWMLTAGLEIVALVCGVLAVVFGVSALGDLVRDRSVVKGTAAVAIGLPVACALVIASGVLGGKDWETLDYTEAWDRLQIGAPEDEPSDLEKAVDEVEGKNVSGPQELRREGLMGACYTGTSGHPGDQRSCDDFHRLEVVGRVDLKEGAASAPYPGEDALVAIGRVSCERAIKAVFGKTDLRGSLTVIVPDERAWVANDGIAVCLAETPLSEKGPVQ